MKWIVYYTSLILLLLYGCYKGNTKEDPVEIQTGTTEYPYLIKTKQDLIQMRESVNTNNVVYRNKAYKLMTDLDFAGEPDWIPIGDSVRNDFQGIFDGNGKVIRNIKIGSEEIPVRIADAGLFGYVLGGEIKNLGVHWIRINTSGDSHVGGIAGAETNSKITNCFTTGSFSGSNVGGIVSWSSGTISDCYSTATISGYGNYNYSGGIVGYSSGTISGSYSTGSISGAIVGGIAGSSSIGTIINCYSTGSVSGRITGGIAGSLGGTIINCYSTGNVSATGQFSSYAGGIASDKGSILNCYSSGDVSSTAFQLSKNPDGENAAYVGGILGGNSILPCNFCFPTSIKFCLALNKNLTAFCAYNSSQAYAFRIFRYSNIESVVSNNFAFEAMIVRYGTSGTNLTTTTDFTDTKKHGSNLTVKPVDLLNGYVLANPTYKGISLYNWKVQAGINNGLPVYSK
ncbi:MAG: hypothetical protein Q8S54_04580 [Bacteroidota bacterium]|nr:hypothetical protein [Odoribacter sp.]MDP3642449.1 hypothetical protein [Bacteroidota bacterium]